MKPSRHPGAAYLKGLVQKTGLNPNRRRLADPLLGHTPGEDLGLPVPERIQRLDPEPTPKPQDQGAPKHAIRAF